MQCGVQCGVVCALFEANLYLCIYTKCVHVKEFVCYDVSPPLPPPLLPGQPELREHLNNVSG